jgi:hypothetical protein
MGSNSKNDELGRFDRKTSDHDPERTVDFQCDNQFHPQIVYCPRQQPPGLAKGSARHRAFAGSVGHGALHCSIAQAEFSGELETAPQPVPDGEHLRRY